MMVFGTRRTIRWITAWLGVALISAGLAIGASAATRTTSKTTSKKPSVSPSNKKVASKSRKKVSRKSSRRARRGAWRRRGQQAMDEQRTRQIQEALIREKYLTGEANGKWDDRSKAAMMKYQADNGWQTKVLPDSRALIKLGLGPSYAALNPESLPEGQHGTPAAKSSAPATLPAAGVIKTQP
jgi:hypothetical protein